ncbi:MAG TPA: transcription antitermination factor NusB [Acidimicrobiia bacterium]|nr:transcription antitermination factor NusB [Acidimicrobiia bacterium]
MSKKHAAVRNVGSSTRAAIIDLLCHCDEGAYANEIVPSRLARSKFSDQDRALITKVVYSTLRYQVRIDNALAKMSKRPFASFDPIARNALRSVIAQLIDDFDMYAVVDETIKVIPFHVKGFVNALSRKAIQLHEHDQLFVDETPDVAAGLPSWIYKEIEEVFSDRAKDVAQALNEPASVTLAPFGSVSLDIEGSRHGVIIPEARLIRSMGDIAHLDVIVKGNALVVDQGSQLVAHNVDAGAQDRVLDVCCAPGGKTFLVSGHAQSVVACDVAASRLNKVLDTQERLGVKNVDVLACDARHLPFSGDEKFERVLVDAPCSGLGVLRRRPDARHRITEADVNDLVQLQKQILISAAQHVTSGGKLIYSVCTFTRAETIEIDEWLEKEMPEFISEEIDSSTDLLVAHGRGYLLSPTADNDAMFLLKLRNVPSS